MDNQQRILVLNHQDGIYTAEAVTVSEGSLPESLNGESGFHICHVALLTLFILNQLREDGACTLSEEDAEAIAMASALHDVGKVRIPKGILDFPGKLSPIEYDIVKKHAEFGAEIIEHADFGSLSTAIRSYAVEIARYHHERYDGTGYPEGLRGDAIPLSAQVVALADAYDALTSDRSYKDAFSQDVAVQMIASGMCGVFNDALIDCLLKVVNHRALAALRDRLYRDRSVIADNIGLTPERVLCIGNTEYLTREFTETAFPNSKVTVVGNTQLGSADKIKLFRIKKPSIEAIFETYDFDVVVYFSGDLTYQTSEKNDAEELREVLQYAAETKKEMKVIYLSSLDSAFEQRSDRAILCAAKEQLCEFYARDSLLEIKVVQIPYLYSGTYTGDFLHGVFEQLREHKPVVLNALPQTPMHFISSPDLANLLYRLIENWKSGSGLLSVSDDFCITFADFAASIQALCPEATFDYIGTHNEGKLERNNRGIRNEYGWFATISLLEDLPEEYEKYGLAATQKEMTWWQKVKRWMSEHTLLVKIAELIALFLLTELLLLLTDSAVIFSVVDFRMAYIVIMATVHGLNFGLASAALSSLSWLVAKVVSGTNLLTIFYEPTNWLAFVFFFLVGALCGYIKLRKDDHIRFVDEQNRLLEDKLVFTREIYEDTYREKRDLKKQIIGSKDSFGKIFDITRKLDTVAPQMLYLRTMETFEEVLENKSITVYSVNKQSTFGRLEVASRDIIEDVSRSISTETYATIIEQLKDGAIWRNTELKREYPMYAAGVYRGEELVLLIFLWHADIDQRSLYYINLFKILRDLVQMSLLRAFDYNQAVYEQQYVEHTHIMKVESFDEILQQYGALAEKKVSSFLLLEIDPHGQTPEEMDTALKGKVRTNDLVGLTADGKIRLLLAQATETDLPFILPRFEGMDIRTVG